MANRYWRGGSGSWTTTNTANWSISSGGGGGASVPTAADAVIIDNLSGSPTVTLSGGPLTCQSITTTGATCTIAGTGPTLTVSGSITLSATTTWSMVGSFTINATSTVTTNGVSFGNTGLSFNASGLTLTLGSNLTTAVSFSLSAGTLSLGVGNYTLTCQTFQSTNAVARSIQFGTGSIATTSGGYNIVGTNLTFTGTSNLTMNSGQTATMTTGFTSTNALSLTVSGTGTFTGTAGNVYRNLILTSFTGTLGNTTRTLYGNLTIGASTTVSAGTSATTLALVGTQTITSNGVTLDFPITQSGVAGTVALSGNLTLGTSRAYTQTGGLLSLGANTLSTGIYSNSSGNTPSVSLSAGGNIVITGNATTVLTLSSATNVNSVPISLTYSGATGTRSITGGSNPTNPPVVTIPAGTDTVSLTATASCFASLGLTGFGGTLTTSSTTYAFNVTQNAATTVTIGASPAGGLILNAANTYTLTSGTLTVSNGLSVGNFSSSNTNTRQINNNGGTITLTGSGTIWDLATTTNLTYTGNNTISLINNTASARTFNGGGFTYGPMSIGSPASGSTLTFTGANTFSTFSMSAGAPSTLVFPASTTTTMLNLSITGSAGNVTSLISSSAGTQATLSAPSGSTSNVSYVSIKDSIATGGAIWNAYTTNGNVDNGNNKGWTFAAPIGTMFQLF